MVAGQDEQPSSLTAGFAGARMVDRAGSGTAGGAGPPVNGTRVSNVLKGYATMRVTDTEPER